MPEGRARNHNRPQLVPGLLGIFIEDIAVGAEHTLALSSAGEVYAWGSNSEGQVSDGSLQLYPCISFVLFLRICVHFSSVVCVFITSNIIMPNR